VGIGALVSLPPGISALAGYTVAIASERRRSPMADLFEAQGARTVSVQALRSFTTAAGPSTRVATDDILAAPIDEFVVASNFGLSTWLRAAQRWQVADGLLARIGAARLLAANARAADALRDAGFRDIWSTAAGTVEELFRFLGAQPDRQRRIAVQCDGPETVELCHALQRTGLNVVAVPTFRCEAPVHADILRRLGEQIVNGTVDAVVLSSAEATVQLLAQAQADRRRDGVLNAFVGELPVVCRGELAAAPLRATGVVPFVPIHPYAEDIIDVVRDAVTHRVVRIDVAGRHLEVRGQAVILDDELVAVQPGPIGVLRVLARHPGQVLSFADIRRETPGWGHIDDHAIEMAVSRLRRSLNDADLIQTVLKRGYRLSV
jgi:uroporphyrinogen-III synthase